jgi:broad specificity phosphatase PhoE
MVKFGLIRHARTRWNIEKKLQGKTDIPLSPEGIEEAAHWGELLYSRNYNMILSSPMTRAVETAKIISNKIKVDVILDEDLREQNFGNWEGRKLIDIKKQSPGEIELQESLGWKFCPDGGESRIEVLKRVSNAIEHAGINYTGKNVLVVAHESVIKILIYNILGRSFTPDEKPLLKKYHLHDLDYDEKMYVKKLNSVRLL